MAAIVVVELTLDGESLWNDDGTRVFGIVKGHPGMLPTLRGRDTIVPQSAGRIWRSRVRDTLSIELDGQSHAPDGVSLDDARAAFAADRLALFQLWRRCQLSPKTLEAVLEDGSTATIDARVITGQPVYTERVPGLHGTWGVILESVDPEWVIAAGS